MVGMKSFALVLKDYDVAIASVPRGRADLTEVAHLLKHGHADSLLLTNA